MQNTVLVALRSLGMLGFKHIPVCYMQNSVEKRMQLLAGVLVSMSCIQNNSKWVLQKFLVIAGH